MRIASARLVVSSMFSEDVLDEIEVEMPDVELLMKGL